jgi:tetratricopeptide (TPR) repeat protein
VVSSAHAVNKDRLRAAVELPRVFVSAGICLNSLGVFVFDGQRDDHTAEMARLRKAMKGDTNDAERWQRLALLYGDQGNEAQSDEAQRKAVSLYRERLKARPDDPLTLARLGATLDWDHDAVEAERLLRQAVQQAPGQGECWIELGAFLDSRAQIILLVGKMLNKTGIGQTVAAVMSHPPGPEKVAQTRKLLEEARSCFDLGVPLAQDESDAYSRRACSRAMEGFMGELLDLLEGKPGNPVAGFTDSGAVADLRQVARLRPDDSKARGAAALFALVAAALHADHPVKTHEEMLKLLSPEDQETVRGDLRRIEELCQSTDSAVTAGSIQTLAVIEMIGLGNFYRAATLYQKLVTLQPDNEQAWDALQGCVAREKTMEELVTLSQRRVKLKDSAHNRFLLAKAYAYQECWDKAEEEIKAARKLDTKDYLVALAWAALLTRASRDPASLEAAQAAVVKARELLPPDASNQQRLDGQTIEAICWALAGNADQARKSLSEVLQADPGQEMAKHAMEALDAEAGNAR